LDDLNVPFDPDGPLAGFLRTVTEAAVANNVLVYMITHDKYVAYQLWQINGGNKLTPLPYIVTTINPRPTSWMDWKQMENDIDDELKDALKAHAPPRFLFLRSTNALLSSIEWPRRSSC
jgi:hypothetical protein